MNDFLYLYIGFKVTKLATELQLLNFAISELTFIFAIIIEQGDC